MSGPRIGELFSGYGGLGMGVQAVLGGTIAWHSEIDPGACKILAHRYPDVPNHGDITTIDWASVEPVDVLTGGSPCQDLSHAGKRGGMTEGTRSNLWVSMRDAIAQLRPSLVVWENVRGAYNACADSELGSCPGCVDRRQPHRPLLRAAGRVLGDLASLGFDANWAGVRASDVGAPHGRFRIFVVAWDANLEGLEGRIPRGRARQRAARPTSLEPVADTDGDSVWEQSVAISRSSRPALAGLPDTETAADAHSDGCPRLWRELPGKRHADRRCSTHTLWGDYEPAIRRWERLTRPAPVPNELGPKGPRLSPRFTEWMQGLPDGWVTAPTVWDGMKSGKAREAQLHALGNGVCPPQAAHALRLLLADVGSVAA